MAILWHSTLFWIISMYCLKAEEVLESHQAIMEILHSKNYSSNLVPPVLVPGEAFKVFVNLGLRDIEAIDDKSMELKLQLSIRQKWKDPRLQYPSQDPHAFVTLNADLIDKAWTPDIFVQNEKYSSVHQITRPNSFIRIFPDGSIFQSTGLSLTLSCFMNLARLPFDKQACDIRLSSYGYKKDTLELDWDDEESLEWVTNFKGQHFTQFRFTSQRTARCVMKNMSGVYSAILLRLEFQRQLAYYIFQVFLPCIMLIVITWVAFWLGDAMEARLSLTVTVLLTLATQISGTMQTLPQVSYNTGLGTFTGICLTFAVMSIMETATVFYFMRGEGIGMRRWRTTKIVDLMAKVKAKKMVAMDKKKDGFVDEEAGECERSTMNVGLSLPVKIDNVSKILFPGAFAVFMLVYFVYYLFLWEWGVSKEEIGNENELDHDQICPGWKLK